MFFSLSSLNNLQIRAMLVLWFRWICPGGLWEAVKAVRIKGDDCCVAEDVNHLGRTGKPSLLANSRSSSDVAVVSFELFLQRSVQNTHTKCHLPTSFHTTFCQFRTCTNLSFILVKLFPIIFIRGRHCVLQFFQRRLLYRAFPQCIR